MWPPPIVSARRLPYCGLATVLAALALLVRMMVPAGFMPMAGMGGGPALIICSGAQPSPAMMLPMPGMSHGVHAMAHPASDKSDTTGHGSDHACPFGALAAAADSVGGALALPLPATPSVVLLIAPLFLRPGIGLAAPPPPKTGPPILR